MHGMISAKNFQSLTSDIFNEARAQGHELDLVSLRMALEKRCVLHGGDWWKGGYCGAAKGGRALGNDSSSIRVF
jgi:hypothetical protein